MKKILKFSAWLVATSYLLYQLGSASVYGVIRGRKAGIYTYQDDPALFVVSIIVCIVLLVVLVVIGGHSIDTKVKQFGGNYNLNTLKAIAVMVKYFCRDSKPHVVKSVFSAQA